MIHLKRAYKKFSAGDGERILVERLWPRGLTKARAAAGGGRVSFIYAAQNEEHNGALALREFIEQRGKE